jgi:hypothetical protein
MTMAERHLMTCMHDIIFIRTPPTPEDLQWSAVGLRVNRPLLLFRTHPIHHTHTVISEHRSTDLLRNYRSTHPQTSYIDSTVVLAITRVVGDEKYYRFFKF